MTSDRPSPGPGRRHAWAEAGVGALALAVAAAVTGGFGPGPNMSALIGARGSGPLTEGARAAAVVELSGPMDLTAEALDAGLRARIAAFLHRHLGD